MQRNPFDPTPPTQELPAMRSRRAGTLRTIAIALAGGIAGAAVVAGIDAATDDQPPSQPAVSAQAAAGAETAAPPVVRTGTVDYSALYERAAKGFVSVRATVSGGVRSPLGGGDGVAGGSGFVVDKEGTILTNQHVVADASRVDVTFADGTSARAEVVGKDAATDVAVLDVDVPQDQLHPLKLADSSKVKVGQTALAIGDPYGYQRTLTVGVVSGLDRSIEAPNGFTISGAIQTDAPINAGNSGGPLLNAQGEVIGINAQIAGSTSRGNVGIGFAIPSNTADRVMSQITDSGSATSAWLGVSLDDVDATLAGENAVGGAASGALITGVVPDGPADGAGLRGGSNAQDVAGQQRCLGGDVVTAADGKRVADAEDLQSAVVSKKPGDTLRLDVIRADGEKQALTVELGKQPQQVPETSTGC
jgi:S1-C subfamily serine protease